MIPSRRARPPKKALSCALSSLIALTSAFVAAPALAQFREAARSAAPTVGEVPSAARLAPALLLDAAPPASAPAMPAAAPEDPAPTAEGIPLAPPASAASESASAPALEPAAKENGTDGPEGSVEGDRRFWDGAGSAFGVGANESVSAHKTANGAIKRAYAKGAVNAMFPENAGKPGESRPILQALETIQARRGRDVAVPGLGIVEWKKADVRLASVVADGPALRYRSPRDFQVSHIGSGGKAGDRSVPKEKRETIYLDSRLLDAGLYAPDILEGVLVNELFELRARQLADAQGLAWTQALAKNVHAAARKVAEEIRPGLTAAVAEIVGRLAARKPEKAPSSAKLRSFRLDSGGEIYVTDGEPQKLYLRETADAEPRFLSEGKVTRFPSSKESSRKSAYVPDKTDVFFIATVGDDYWVITRGGRAARLPVSAKTFETDSSGAFTWNGLEFSANGRNFQIATFDRRGENNGATFLIRDDGAFLQIDSKYHDDVEMELHPEGLLEIDGTPRLIDLDHFDAEARFQPQVAKRVTDGQGEDIEDPVQFLDENFGDVGKDIERNPGTVFDSGDDAQTKAYVAGIRSALAEPETGSVAFLGEAGSGKTQAIRAFIAAAKRGDFPEIARTTRFVGVDAAALGQGTTYVGAIESKVKALTEACGQVPCILFMDEIQSLRGQGAHKDNPNDFFQYIKTGLANGSLRIIGTSTDDEFYEAFAGDSALFRRFRIVAKPEPSEDKVLSDMKAWTKRFGRAAPSDDVLRLMIRLSGEFNAAGAQPAKATGLLARTYATLEIAGRPNDVPTEEAAKAAAAELYNVDPSLFDPRQRLEKLSLLPGRLDEKIVGQQWAKSALVELERQRFAGAQDPTKPAVSLIEAGTPGVGKTALGFAFAAAMDRPAVRIEMNRFAEGGVEEFRREMARAIQKNAFSVLILDEFEKAHRSVQLAVLALLDGGSMSVRESLSASSGKGGRMVKYSFRNASLILTTNAGQQFVAAGGGSGGRHMGFDPLGRESPRDGVNHAWDGLKAAIEADGVPDTVLDRVQAVVALTPSTRDEFKAIVRMHLSGILKEQGERQRREVVVENPEEFAEFVAAHYYKEGMSNRVVLDVTRGFARAAIAEAVLTPGNGEGPLRLRFDPVKFAASSLAGPPRN